MVMVGVEVVSGDLPMVLVVVSSVNVDSHYLTYCSRGHCCWSWGQCQRWCDARQMQSVATCIARRMVLQGEQKYCKTNGDARQCCKPGRECCKECCKARTGKDNLMLQYLPVIQTTANRATPPDGRDRK